MFKNRSTFDFYFEKGYKLLNAAYLEAIEFLFNFHPIFMSFFYEHKFFKFSIYLSVTAL